MSDLGDYLYEMDRIQTSDAEIEALLSGSPQLGEDLQPLADLFSAIRANAGDELTDDAVAAYVAAATAASVAALPASHVRTQRSRRPLLGTLRRRAATVTVAATVLLGGTSGLAVAADGAKPGDALYGLDRAFEAVGIGAGAQQERLSEAEALLDDGEIHLGLDHAAQALEDSESGGGEASQALMDAADRVRAAGADPSAATRERVAGLLSYISDNVGNLDGRQVAELAVEIGGPKDRPNTPPASNAPDAPGPPDDNPANPPGLSDRDPGRPDDKPTTPPGLSDQDPGPPDHVPADPPGQSKENPSTTKPPKDKP